MNDAERRVVKTNSDCGDRSLSGELKKNSACSASIYGAPIYAVIYESV